MAVEDWIEGDPPLTSDGLVALGGQSGLKDVLVWLSQGHGHQQPPRRLARFHAPGASDSAGKRS